MSKFLIYLSRCALWSGIKLNSLKTDSDVLCQLPEGSRFSSGLRRSNPAALSRYKAGLTKCRSTLASLSADRIRSV